MILILKISSIFVTALLGILSLLFNFRDDEGKITHQGKLILSTMLLSFFISIVTTITESFQGAKDAQDQLAKTVKVLHEFSRTQSPITRAKIIYRLELPQDNASVRNYSTLLDELVMTNADQFLHDITSVDQLQMQSSNKGLRRSASDMNGDPISISVEYNSKYWPSEAYEALSSTVLTYSFLLFIKKENV